MPLSDYAVKRDRFELTERARFAGFPCAACRHGCFDADSPCRSCDHNVNAAPAATRDEQEAGK